MDVSIDPEFANLCRPLTPEEKSQLEANLRAEGCRDPLVAWGGTLLDGHNRYEICQRLGLLFDVKQASNVKDRADAISWIIANQLGRRNLIPEDVSYLRGKQYEAEKLSPSEHGAVARKAQLAQGENLPGPPSSTAIRLGKKFGVSDHTMKSDAAFAVSVDKIDAALGRDVSGLIRTGKSGLTKKAVIDFAKDDDMTIQKFNDIRFEHQQKLAKQQKERKKSSPKRPPLTRLKTRDTVDVAAIERMRAFMHAVVQIATSPVIPATMAAYQWPPNFRGQMIESLPLATEYLAGFAEAFNSNLVESPHGNETEAQAS